MPANIFIAFLHWVLLAVAAQPLPRPLPQKSVCVVKLVAFSPCLPYVSAPPNNTTNFVDPKCCNAFSSAFESDDGHCFCYILRLPLIFGFPLNKTRLDSLSSFCMAKNGTASLDSLCSSGEPAPPPLPSTTESGLSKPYNSEAKKGYGISIKLLWKGYGISIKLLWKGYGISIKLLWMQKSYQNYSTGSDNDSSAFTYSSPDSAERSPTPPSSSVEQDIISSATNQIYKNSTWFLLGMMIFVLICI
ncbi:hypothetical protein DITRI_Ditri15bG0081900 [Diplodiscus trichospermus]